MPRYIDADLIPYVESENGVLDDYAYRYDINEIPTADVVPREELEGYKHNWQKIAESYTTDCAEHYERGRREGAREIFEEIENLMLLCACDYGHLHHEIRKFKRRYKREG